MIPEKINYIYQNLIPKNPIMLCEEEAIEYFRRLLMNGNIITCIKDGELIGFLEYWRLDYEKFGRVCSNCTLSHEEDLLHGPVALITRMWITPDSRNAEVFINLGREFLIKNKDAEHFAAMQMHKSHKPLQVYTREQVLKHYRMEK